jgi:hypothetical protein
MRRSLVRKIVAAASTAIICTVSAFAAPITLDANGADVVSDLQKIALAMHNYESAFGSFPPQHTGGVNTPLLSWRVALLPFLNEADLYNLFDLTKPWDDPANIGLLAQMPDVYRTPLDPPGSTHARYAVGTAPNTIFDGGPGIKIIDVSDGTSDTLLVGETDSSSIPWTKPEDISIGQCPALGQGGFSSFVPGAVPFAFADGSVRFLPNTIDCQALKGLFLRNDGGVDRSMALDYVIEAVPEPDTLFLFAVGIAALGLKRRLTWNAN